MEGEFKHLFSPLTVGPMVLPNRLMMTAHTTLYNNDGAICDRYISYLAERAKGGVGSIVTAQQMAHPTSEHRLNDSFAFDEKVIPVFRRLADELHQHGCKLIFQIGHAGRQADSSLSRVPLLAPSPIPCPTVRETPKRMELEDIAEVVRGFGRVASNARAAGADGVEIHAATGYLVQQFLSPFSNHRTDAYGGTLENRLRFALEVIEETREKAGPNLAVGIRVSGDEFVEGGLTLDDMEEICARLAATGKIDYISVFAGNYVSIRNYMPMGMDAPLGLFVYLASRIKSAVDIPVVASGRIVDPAQAEHILFESHADIIGMTRALICDPEFANKARTGHSDDIRTCVGCNQGCFARLFANKPICCLQNAAVGREKDMGIHTLKPTSARKRILVAGGGPAGLEAARIAAIRGHEVQLYEKSSELGGQVKLASRIPSREEFGGIVRFLAHQIDKLKVDVHLAVEVTPDLVQQVSPDAVIVATGSHPARPTVPGIEQSNVLSIRDALLGLKPIGQRVLIIDDDGHQQGPSLAAFIAEQGKAVEVVTRLPFVGFELPLSQELGPTYMKLLSFNVVLTPFTAMKRIDGASVWVANVFSEAESERKGVDTIILICGNEADDELYHSLKGKVKELYSVGDCVAPRRAMDAIYDANRIARLL